MIYGYLRVSTDLQDVNTCKNEIIQKCTDLGFDPKNIIWIDETVSGSVIYTKRKLGEAFNLMFKGDILICSELSRIGRKILDVMKFISEGQEKGIKIYFTKTDFKVDGSIESNMLVFSYALSSQIERELISQRTKNALQNKRNQGITLGRPKGKSILDKFKTEIQQKYQLGISQKKLSEQYGVNKMTMNRYIKSNFTKVIT
ncbi:MAG: recombinase family protein [Patescibacteria group bacterium]